MVIFVMEIKRFVWCFLWGPDLAFKVADRTLSPNSGTTEELYPCDREFPARPEMPDRTGRSPDVHPQKVYKKYSISEHERYLRVE
jgi:hypothetical protein